MLGRQHEGRRYIPRLPRKVQRHLHTCLPCGVAKRRVAGVPIQETPRRRISAAQLRHPAQRRSLLGCDRRRRGRVRPSASPQHGLHPRLRTSCHVERLRKGSTIFAWVIMPGSALRVAPPRRRRRGLRVPRLPNLRANGGPAAAAKRLTCATGSPQQRYRNATGRLSTWTNAPVVLARGVRIVTCREMLPRAVRPGVGPPFANAGGKRPASRIAREENGHEFRSAARSGQPSERTVDHHAADI